MSDDREGARDFAAEREQPIAPEAQERPCDRPSPPLPGSASDSAGSAGVPPALGGRAPELRARVPAGREHPTAPENEARPSDSCAPPAPGTAGVPPAAAGGPAASPASPVAARPPADHTKTLGPGRRIRVPVFNRCCLFTGGRGPRECLSAPIRSPGWLVGAALQAIGADCRGRVELRAEGSITGCEWREVESLAAASLGQARCEIDPAGHSFVRVRAVADASDPGAWLEITGWLEFWVRA